MANGIYGQTGQGLNPKTIFDARSGQVLQSKYGVLTNPIIAQAISGNVRAVLSEVIHNIHQSGGNVTSCTTDGFITNLDIFKMEKDILKGDLNIKFSQARKDLTGDPMTFEIITQGEKLAS